MYCSNLYDRRQKELEAKLVEEETAKRIEEMVAKRVEEELERRRDEIEEEVLRRVNNAKIALEQEMMEELQRQKAAQLEAERVREVSIHHSLSHFLLSPKLLIEEISHQQFVYYCCCCWVIKQLIFCYFHNQQTHTSSNFNFKLQQISSPPSSQSTCTDASNSNSTDVIASDSCSSDTDNHDHQVFYVKAGDDWLQLQQIIHSRRSRSSNHYYYTAFVYFLALALLHKKFQI